MLNTALESSDDLKIYFIANTSIQNTLSNELEKMDEKFDVFIKSINDDSLKFNTQLDNFKLRESYI